MYIITLVRAPTFIIIIKNLTLFVMKEYLMLLKTLVQFSKTLAEVLIAILPLGHNM